MDKMNFLIGSICLSKNRGMIKISKKVMGIAGEILAPRGMKKIKKQCQRNFQKVKLKVKE